MKTDQYLDYRDPQIIAQVLNKAQKIKEAKEIQAKEEAMSTHEEIIKEDEDVKHDRKKSESYFFKNILFFTNDRDSESNKTLKNLEKAVKNKGVEIFPFVAEEVDYKATDDQIEWHDNQNKYKVDEQSNIDTLLENNKGGHLWIQLNIV